MISVLIPTHHDAAALGRCLQPLVPAAMDGFVTEVIVADAGSTDETLELADDAGCRILKLDGDARARIEAAAQAARGRWLLVLDPGAQLPAGWDAAARDHIERYPDRPARFVAARRWPFGLGGKGPWALLTPRDRLGRTGGARVLAPRLLGG